jgi:flagellar biosynthetic protein FliP
MKRDNLRTAHIRWFARHYVEMVAAMFAGMFVLGLPAAGALELAGSGLGELEESAPAVYLLGMGISMTVGMVGWMRYRGHGWRPASEMAGAMMAPTFAVIFLLGLGVLDFGGAMMIEHVTMFPAMLAVMLARWEEYSAPDATRRRTEPRGAEPNCRAGAAAPQCPPGPRLR